MTRPASASSTSGISGCQPASCEHLASNFLMQLAGSYGVLYLLGVAVILLTPAVIGLFWGAPLIARELDTRTATLAWNQSITRTRWLAVKLTVGALIRRAVPAMAVTLAIFAAVQIAVPLWIRPHLFPADHRVIPITSLERISISQAALPGHGSSFTLGAQNLPGQPGAWLLSSHAANAARQPVSTTPVACTAPSIANSPALVGCLASHGIQEAVTYQPARRYWPIQWIETAIYLALALVLTGSCFRRLNRRLS